MTSARTADEHTPVPPTSAARPAPAAPVHSVLAVRKTAEFEPDREDDEEDDLPDIDEADALLGDTKIVLPPEIVKGLLHKGTKGVLASASKAGKTWLLLDLAVCVAIGRKFLKWETTKGKVLFVNFEIPKPFMKERLRAIKLKRRVDERLTNLHIWTLRGFAADFSLLMGKIIRKIRSDNYSLVVLDPIYKGMVGKDENTASAVGVLCNSIEDVAVKTGAAIVYAHHFTKGNQAGRESIDRMSGSGVFARDADTIVTLTPHDEEDCYTVEMTLRNFPHQTPFVVQFAHPIMEERLDLDPDKLRGKGGRPAGDRENKLLDLLRTKAMRSGEWEEAALNVGIPRATFSRDIKKLKAAKKVTLSEATKKWHVVEAEPVPEPEEEPQPEDEPGEELVIDVPEE